MKEKGTAYVPFSFEVTPIKKIAIIEFQQDPDTVYKAFELHYFDGEPYGTGYRVLAWRKDGFMDVYAEKSLPFHEDENLSIGRKGTKERFETAFEKVYFSHEDGNLTVGFTFLDKMKRKVVVHLDENIEQDSNALTWIPPVGLKVVEPISLPVFIFYHFDFARKRDTVLSISIDGEEHKPDPFGFPKDFQARHAVRFTMDPIVTHFNKAGTRTLPQVKIDEDGYAYHKEKRYLYELKDGLYHLKQLVIQHPEHPVTMQFDPPFPNHKEVIEAKPHYGTFTITGEGDTGHLTAKYNVIRQGDKAIFNISFPNGWEPDSGSTIERLTNNLTLNVLNWYKTYHCVQIIDLNTMESKTKWQLVNPDRRS